MIIWLGMMMGTVSALPRINSETKPIELSKWEKILSWIVILIYIIFWIGIIVLIWGLNRGLDRLIDHMAKGH